MLRHQEPSTELAETDSGEETDTANEPIEESDTKKALKFFKYLLRESSFPSKNHSKTLNKLMQQESFNKLSFQNRKERKKFLANVDKLLTVIEKELITKSSPVQKEFLHDCIKHTSTLLHYNLPPDNTQERLLQFQRIAFERYKQDCTIQIRQDIENIVSVKPNANESPSKVVDFQFFCDNLVLKSLEQISNCFSLTPLVESSKDSESEHSETPESPKDYQQRRNTPRQKPTKLTGITGL